MEGRDLNRQIGSIHRDRIVVTGLVAGLVIGCSPVQVPFQASSPVPLPVSPTPEITVPTPGRSSPSPTPTVSGDPFQKGVDRASSATTLTQSAQTPDDWSLVLSRWKEAIGFMQAVPPASPNHAAAKKLLTEYQQSLARAQQQAKRGPNRSPILARVNPEGGIPLIALESPAKGDAANEPVNTMNALVQQQIQFWLKEKRFATNLQELGSNLPASSNRYLYSTRPLQERQAIVTAAARQGEMPSYTGAIFFVKDENNSENPITGICVTSQPSRVPPALPQLVGKQVKCPAGSSSL